MNIAKHFKPFICLGLLFVTPHCSHAQMITVSGIVTDDKHIPIQYCAVENTNMNTGVYTDEHGKFSITLNTDSVRSLSFSSLGYQLREILVKDLAKANEHSFIELHPAEVALKNFTVHSKKEHKKEHTLGINDPHHDGAYYLQYGDEVAICLQANPDYRVGYLKQVYFYITDEGAPGTVFKVNIYKKDTVLLAPGINLIDSLYLHATKGNEWVAVDVSDAYIPTLGGVFIGIEGISTGNSIVNYHYPFPKNWTYGTSPDAHIYNGQALGSTCDYGLVSRAFIRHRNSSNDSSWSYIESPGGGKHSRWFNPMIYATYTYKKKN